jgi:hypothetical protein
MPNERQLATLIWLGLVLVLLIWYPKTRSSVRDLASTAVHPQIVIPVSALLGYVSGLAFAGWLLSLWTIELMTDTVFWWVGTALVLLVNIDRAWKTERFFRRTALGVVGASAFAEFFINDLFVFSLPVELVLLPVLSMLVMMSVVADRQPEFQSVKRLMDTVVALVGLGLAGYVGFRVVTAWSELNKADVLRSLALPVWLMLGMLPFIYVISLYATYQVAFTWIDFRASGGSRWRAKLTLLLRLRGRVRDVGAFTMAWGREMASTTSFREAWRVAGRFRASRRERQRAEAAKQDRLQQYAGVLGVDDEGRRLDRREFDETTRALQILASAQMGWYRNHGGRHRPELLEILAPQFEWAGLPEDHLIELHVSDDGQSWWAWRRAVTGWCFAIGAAGPPPDEWLFDGPQPPQGFPGQDEAWGARWGVDARNW